MIRRALPVVLAVVALLPSPGSHRVGAQGPAQSPPVALRELWRQVEIIRTAHGVPHIRAENMRAAGYALAWLQAEDYGPRSATRLVTTRGQQARTAGRASLDADFDELRSRARAIETYHLLDQETRDMYDGFAAGINRYVELHRTEYPAGFPTDFTGYDVASLHIGDAPPAARVRRFLTAVRGGTPAEIAAADINDRDPEATDEDGSNAWALAPSRTTSGHAILLRNPHLVWTSGYYEAHMTVKDVMDFYGDFRIGGPLGVIGGFNKYLGWATTNSNTDDRTEIYSVALDPKRPDHYLLDGASLPLKKETVTVEFRDGERMSSETRELWSMPLGPVIHRTADKVFIVRTAGANEYRSGEQFLRLMRAKSLAEFKEAMKIRALVSQNYTYADRAGNIYHLWNGSMPLLPHDPGGDAATPISRTGDAWTRLIPFDDLPQWLNPRGGYIHNENDSPHFTNIRGAVNLVNRYPNIEAPSLDLRSQHAIQLIGGTQKFSLEGVIRLKHSYRMLLADRAKADLIAAVKATKPAGDVAAAVTLLQKWNNTVAPDTKGSTIFEAWFGRYAQGRPDSELFAQPWTATVPMKTPRGLSDPVRAAEAFVWAVEDTKKRYGRIDVTWGDVHRIRRGKVDEPIGGCPGRLGCFRVLGYARDSQDGKLVANTGDGWVLAVEFGPTPRAYSVLAYGQSSRPESPWHSDQAAMFAKGRLKKVAFTSKDVDAQAVVRYRPGER
jgi:acyl-homoserine-lactone acylase